MDPHAEMSSANGERKSSQIVAEQQGGTGEQSKENDELKIASSGDMEHYLSMAAQALESAKNEVTLRAVGAAIPRAICVAELVKRRVKGVHQLTTVSIKPGLRPPTGYVDERPPREVALMSIKLSIDMTSMDTNDAGYQPPLSDSDVLGPGVELDALVAAASRRNFGEQYRGGYRDGRRGGRGGINPRRFPGRGGRGGRGRGIRADYSYYGMQHHHAQALAGPYYQQPSYGNPHQQYRTLYPTQMVDPRLRMRDQFSGPPMGMPRSPQTHQNNMVSSVYGQNMDVRQDPSFKYPPPQNISVFAQQGPPQMLHPMQQGHSYSTGRRLMGHDVFAPSSSVSCPQYDQAAYSVYYGGNAPLPPQTNGSSVPSYPQMQQRSPQ